MRLGLTGLGAMKELDDDIVAHVFVWYVPLGHGIELIPMGNSGLNILGAWGAFESEEISGQRPRGRSDRPLRIGPSMIEAFRGPSL